MRGHAVLGDIRQNGYVVDDLDAALTHWITVLGVGPWIVVDPLPATDFVHRGEATEPLDMAIALAHVGTLQIELIQQRCATPSAYREFLTAHGPGLHHLAFWPADLDHALTYVEADLGWGLIGGGQVGPGGRFRYYDTDPGQGSPIGGGTVMELADVRGARLAWFEQLAIDSRSWDGTTPAILNR